MPRRASLLRVARGGNGDTCVHVTMSHAMMERLVAEDRLANFMVRYAVQPGRRYAGIYMLFSRPFDMAVPAFHMQVEVPGPDPHGQRVTMRADKPGVARVWVRARRIGVDYDRLRAIEPQLYFPGEVRGLTSGVLVMLPDEFMLFPGPKDRNPETLMLPGAFKTGNKNPRTSRGVSGGGRKTRGTVGGTEGGTTNPVQGQR